MSVVQVILAHAGGTPHVHPHGIDVASVLVVGGLLVLVGLGVRAARRRR